ncbi:MAG TPA: protein kinase [Gemmataceae bacterium]|nr:protein kinase [Gemmataceae bacterium]
MSASESRSLVVLELAEEFLERYRQGQRPSLKEYIDRHPELAAEIKEVFPAMALMENVALANESLAGAATGAATPSESAPPSQLGDYRILREVGRGGMGIVYEAEQISLGRHVALKVLPRKTFANDQQRQRFEREAKAAAKLHHTNIVPVFGVGEHDGLPYYVMQFIQGLGMDDVLRELKRMQGSGASAGGELRVARKDVPAADVARSLLTGAFSDGESEVSAFRAGVVGPPSEPQEADDPCSEESVNVTSKLSDTFALSSAVHLPSGDGKGKKATYWQSVAQIGVQVAEALEYAHKQGFQHRDIKPSNLLLDTRGTVWVTDFGLARADNEDHLTITGDIVGTLRYMPPEAFEGRTDKRGDIYSLGLTLYELLALQPAYAERERHRLILRVTTEEPPRLNKLRRSIPRDLVTIIHKAIDREPGRRYQTAAEFAADLQRFLDDEPIRARRISNGERLLRWCRHHPDVATLIAALALILVAVTVVSVVVAARFDLLAKEKERLAKEEKQIAADEREARQTAEKAKNAAEEAKKREATQLRRAENALYYSRIALAERAWQANDVRTAEQLLDRAARDRNQGERRDWEWHYLKGLCHFDLLTLTGHRDDALPYSVAYSPDGRFLASASRCYFRVAANQPRPSDIIIWDARTGQRLRTLDSSSIEWPLAMLYSFDGNYLAVLIDKRQPKPPMGAAPRVDGNYFAANIDKPNKVWDTRSWMEVAPTAVKDVAFRRQPPLHIRIDGDAIRLAKASGEKLETLRGHTGSINGVDVDLPAHRLASSATDQTVRVWNIEDGAALAIFRGHTNAVDSVVFSPDGSRLASASVDGTIKIWDLRRDPRGLRVPATNGLGSEWLAAFAFSGDSRRIYTLPCDGPGPCLRTLDALGGRFLDRRSLLSLSVNLQFDPYLYFNTAFVFSPTGDRAAGPRRNERNVLSVCDRVTGRELAVLSGHAGPITVSAFSPDGRRLATASPSFGEVKLWDAATGKEVVRLRQPSGEAPFRARSLAFSPDGTRLAAGPGGGESPSGIWIWDVAGGDRLAVFQPRITYSPCLTFNGEGGKLAVVVPGRAVEVLDAATGEMLFVVPRLAPLEWAAFSPDGRRLAAAGRHGEVYLYDADNGQDILALSRLAGPPPGNYGFVPRVVFSPDGSRLAANNWDGTLTVWSAEDLTPAERAARLEPAEKRAFDLWLTDLNQQLKDRPDDARLYLERGRLFARRGHFKEAEADFDQAIRFDLKSPHPWIERGRWFAEQGDDQKADADFDQAAQVNLDDPLIWEELGRRHLEREQWDKAMHEYTQLVRLLPFADPRIRFRHGYVLLRGGDRAGYRKACRDMLQHFGQSNDPRRLNWTVRTCILGAEAVADTSQLVQAARKALVANPGHSGMLFALAAAHYRAREFDKAIQGSKEALDAKARRDSDDRVLSWLVLAMAHQRLGQTETASKWLQQAVHWLAEHSRQEARESNAWHDRLIAECLCREAQTLLEENKTEPKK